MCIYDKIHTGLLKYGMGGGKCFYQKTAKFLLNTV